MCVCAVYVTLVFWALRIYQNIHTLCDAKRCDTKRDFFLFVPKRNKVYPLLGLFGLNPMFVFISTVWKAVDGNSIRA